MEPLFAVYDACVLYAPFLRDFLVRLAIRGQTATLLRAKWTGRIHHEWIRAVRRRKPELTQQRLMLVARQMDSHVRGCRVRGYQRWERRLVLPDPDDRHVLAAALACVADVIVTFNTRDFPAEVLRPFGVEAVSPDTLMTRSLGMELVVAAAAEHRAALARPALSPNEYLDALRRNQLPAAAAALATDHAGQF